MLVYHSLLTWLQLTGPGGLFGGKYLLTLAENWLP